MQVAVSKPKHKCARWWKWLNAYLPKSWNSHGVKRRVVRQAQRGFSTFSITIFNLAGLGGGDDIEWFLDPENGVDLGNKWWEQDR